MNSIWDFQYYLSSTSCIHEPTVFYSAPCLWLYTTDESAMTATFVESYSIEH